MVMSHTVHVPKRILLVGFGELGSLVFDQLCRESRPGDQITVLVRDAARVRQRFNLARLCAIHAGCHPAVDYMEADLFDVARTAECIAKFNPDIVFNSASIQSWWHAHEVPGAMGARLREAHFGPWLPMHLTLVHRLMLALRDANVAPRVVNAAFPDAVNPVLACHELAPDVGIGNASNAVPGILLSAAEHLQVPSHRIDVRFIAHHYVSHSVSSGGNAGGAPYLLRVAVDGCDQTAALPDNPFERLRSRFKRCGGRAGMAMTASSAMAVLRALRTDADNGVIHAPGPLGLPGGYPIRVVHGAVRLALPDGVSLQKAIDTNTQGQIFDGIETIQADGTVLFTEREMRCMRDVLGYDVRSMTVHDSADLAKELRDKFLGLRAAVAA